MNRMHAFSLVSLSLAALCGTAVGGVACDTEDATMTVLDNAYPASPDGGGDPATQTVVYRAWWVTTYFSAPVPAGMSSDVERTVPVADFAYAVLAPKWDPASATPPANLVVVKSKAPLAIDRGDTLHIAVSDQTFMGNCASNQPLSQDDADFITQRIFPGEFANVTYDAKTCTTTLVPTDDGGTEGAAGDAEAEPDPS